MHGGLTLAGWVLVAVLIPAPSHAASTSLLATENLARAAEDAELAAFRRREEREFASLATNKAWLNLLERASDTLVKLPDDPFILGWAGLALTKLGYGETGTALMRGARSLIRAPVFQRELSSSTSVRDTTLVVTASTQAMSAAEAEALRGLLSTWATEFLSGSEPIARDLDAVALRAVTGFLADLRASGLSPRPEQGQRFDNGTLEFVVRGHSPARPFPPLTLVVTDGDFARLSLSATWEQERPVRTEVRLQRFANLRLPGVFADACRNNPESARVLVARMDDTDVVTVRMPDAATAVIEAEFFGCRWQESGGSIRVPWLDWPDNRIRLKFAGHDVILDAPAGPEVVTLEPSAYAWMQGTIELRHVPESFVATRDGSPIVCRVSDRVGSCVLPTGDYAIDVAADGRASATLSGHMAFDEIQKHNVRLARLQTFNFGASDAGALAVAGVGGAGAVGAFAVVASTRQGLKDTAGVMPVGKAKEARAVEFGANIGWYVGWGLVALGLGAEAWLLGADVIESQRLPEWE
jgi:hypothetical protein